MEHIMNFDNPYLFTFVATSAKYLTLTINHPVLNATDPASIRTFVRAYDQYVNESSERAKQLSVTMVLSTETVTSVILKLCYNMEWVESLIAHKFIKDVELYEALEDKTL